MRNRNALDALVRVAVFDEQGNVSFDHQFQSQCSFPSFGFTQRNAGCAAIARLFRYFRLLVICNCAQKLNRKFGILALFR